MTSRLGFTISTYLSVCASRSVCKQVCMYVCMYVYVYVYVCMYIYIYTYVYTHYVCCITRSVDLAPGFPRRREEVLGRHYAQSTY